MGGTKGAQTALAALLEPPPEPRNEALLELSDSFWKGNSRKFACKILHNIGPTRALRHVPDVGKHTRQHYMSWWRIKMRGCE